MTRKTSFKSLLYIVPKLFESSGLGQHFMRKGMALFILATFSFTCQASNHDRDTVLDVAVFFAHGSLDPIYVTTMGDYFIGANINEPLVTIDRTGKLAPGLAESWEVSAEGKVYTFTLRDNIYWSDGHPITAQDFILTFHRLDDTQLDTFSKVTYLTEFIFNSAEVVAGSKSIDALGVKALNDRTVEITLHQPVPFFTSILAFSSFSPSPSHVIEQQGENWTDLASIVTSGAYVPTQYGENSELYLEKNQYYYGKDDVYLEAIQLHHRESRTDVFVDLLTGKLDLIQRYSGNQLSDIDEIETSPVALIPTQSSSTNYLAFNLDNDKLKDENIRRALSMVINRAELAQQLHTRPTSSFAAPSLASGWESVAAPWADLSLEQRTEQAKMLMRSAGFSAFNRLKLDLKVNDQDQVKRAVQIVKQQWGDIWVDANIIVQPSRDHYVDLRKGNYQVARAGWAADYDDPLTFLAVLGVESPKNYARWENHAYQKHLDDLGAINYNTNERFAIYRELEKLIHAETPIAPLYNSSYYSILSKRWLGPENTLQISSPIFRYIRPNSDFE